MKKISKLMITGTLLVSGALVCFGADTTSMQGPNAKPMTDMNNPSTNKDMKSMNMKDANQANSDDYVAIIAITDKDTLRKAIQEKLSTNEKARSFLGKIYEKADKNVKAKIDELRKKFSKEPAKDKFKPEHVNAVLLIISDFQKSKPAEMKPASRAPMDKMDSTSRRAADSMKKPMHQSTY